MSLIMPYSIKTNPIVSTTALVLTIKITGVMLFAGYTVFLARILPVESYGIIMYTITIINVAGQICLLGFDKSVLKFAAVYTANNDKKRLKGLLGEARKYSLILSVIPLLLLLVPCLMNLLQINVLLNRSILISLFLLPLWAWILLDMNFLRGLGHTGHALFGFNVLQPLTALLITAFFIVFFSGVDVWEVSISFGLSIILVMIAGHSRISKKFDTGLLPDKSESDRWWKTNKPMIFSTVMNVIMGRADILLIGIFLGIKDVAIYAVASRLAALLAFSLDAFRTSLAPVIARDYYLKDMQGMQSRVSYASKMIFLTTMPPALLFWAFPGFFLGIFGEIYRDGAIIFILLTAGKLVSALSGTVGILLNMTDYQKLHARIMFFCMCLYICIILVFIRLWGGKGVAFATALALMIQNVCMVFMVKNKLNIRSYVLLSELFKGPWKIRYL